MQSTRLRPSATVKYKKYDVNEEEDSILRVSPGKFWGSIRG